MPSTCQASHSLSQLWPITSWVLNSLGSTSYNTEKDISRYIIYIFIQYLDSIFILSRYII